MKNKKPIHIKAKNKGKLHQMLKVPEDKSIPEKKLLAAMKNGTPLEKKRANFAIQSRKWNHSK